MKIKRYKSSIIDVRNGISRLKNIMENKAVNCLKNMSLNEALTPELERIEKKVAMIVKLYPFAIFDRYGNGSTIDAIPVKDYVDIIEHVDEIRSENEVLKETAEKAMKYAFNNPASFKQLFPHQDVTNTCLYHAKEVVAKYVLMAKTQIDLIINDALGHHQLVSFNNQYFRGLDAPCKRFYMYLKNPMTQEQRNVNQCIYQLLDNRGNAPERFATKVYLPFLKELFKDYDLDDIVFVCTPAHTQLSTDNRYNKFIDIVCRETGMENGTPYITMTLEGDAKSKFEAWGDIDYTLDENYFKDKFVIIYDILATKGNAVAELWNRLKSAGAIPVLITLAAKESLQMENGDIEMDAFDRDTPEPVDNKGTIWEDPEYGKLPFEGKVVETYTPRNYHRLFEDGQSEFDDMDEDLKKHAVAKIKTTIVEQMPEILNNYTKFVDYVMNNMFKDDNRLVGKYKEIRQHMLAMYNNLKQHGDKWGDLLPVSRSVLIEIREFDKELENNGLLDKAKKDQLLSNNMNMYTGIGNYTKSAKFLQSAIDFENGETKKKSFGKGLGESKMFRFRPIRNRYRR